MPARSFANWDNSHNGDFKGRDFGGGQGPRSWNDKSGFTAGRDGDGGRNGPWIGKNDGKGWDGKWDGKGSWDGKWDGKGSWNGKWDGKGSWNRQWEHGEHAHWNNNWHNKGDWDHHFHNNSFFVAWPFWNWWPWWWNAGYGAGFYGYDLPSYCYAPLAYDVAYDVAATTPAVQQAQYVAPDTNTVTQRGEVYFGQAADAFESGQYRDAMRLANHAAIESPQNPKAPELMSLAMFALGEYRGAATYAHGALALGPASDWPTLVGYYNNPATYTDQLRALEKYAKGNLTAPDARFLLAYHYMMTGHTDDATQQLREVVKLAPDDRLGRRSAAEVSGGAVAGREALPVPPTASQLAPAQTGPAPTTPPETGPIPGGRE